MCYEAEQYVSPGGKKPVLEFMMEHDKETQDWIIAGIMLLEKNKGRLTGQNLETKHIRNKIFELKFKKLAIRILFAYHPLKRKFVLLLHGLIKKRDDLKSSDIKIAEDRYNEVIKRGNEGEKYEKN